LSSSALTELVKRGAISSISVLRTNQKGYPFVTLLNRKKESTNLYFGKKTSELVLNAFKEGDSIIPFLKESEVVETLNENKETRFKISKNTSDYTSEDMLLNQLGLEVSNSEFDFEKFVKEFTPVEEVVPQA
jgi:hypothetical protein